MRVAHIIKVTRISGAERHLLVLLNGLRNQAIDIHLIILVEPDTPMDEMLTEAQAVDIPIHRVIIHRDYDLTTVYRLRQTLRKIKPDIVHTHLIHADLFGYVSAKLAGIRKVISSRHNDDSFRYHPVLRRFSQVMWWLADSGIAISSAIRTFTINIESASKSKVVVVHYGLPYRWIPDEEINTARLTIRQELGLEADAIILGMVCRLVEQKGIIYALQSLQELITSFPDVHLVIAGDGELADELKNEATRLGIHNHIHWLGWRDDAQIIMAAMDIFIMPSLWEGFGLVLLEAMSKRLPIVATHVSAIPEVVEHGNTGFLVAPRNPEQLTKAITRLLDDRPLRKYMGLLGEDRLEQVFSVEKMVDKTLQIYRKLLDL